MPKWIFQKTSGDQQGVNLVLFLISNLTNELCLHQFLLTKTTKVNKSLETDANGAH